MLIVGIDTGLRACGLGVADLTTGSVLHGSLVKNPSDSEEPATVWLAMAGAVRLAVGEVCQRELDDVALVIVERQYIPKTHPNPNQLIGLMCVVGALLATVPAPWKISVYPSQWKGSEGKDRKNRGTWAKLSAKERERVKGAELKTTGHNVLDGVGMARWGRDHFDRITKGEGK